MTPAWVYDIVIGLQEIEDMHSKDDGRCVAHLLAYVDDNTQRVARGIAAYNEMVTHRTYPPCRHRPNSTITQYTPCAMCAHEKAETEGIPG